MPKTIHTSFLNKYNLSAEMVIEKVYNGPMPNQFLASFAPFINEYFEDEYCQKIIYSQFDKYIKNNILMYANVREHDLYFCGSIAYYYKEILNTICKKHNLNIKSIIKEPINDLTKYFMEA